MTQLDLFTAHARHTDPATSHEAAERMSGEKLAACQQSVLNAITCFPGRTPGELSRLSGLDYYAIQRRVSELQRGGKIVSTAERVCTVRGNRARVWLPSVQQEAEA